MNNRGQSLIEVIFAIGVVGMVLTGIAALLVNSLGSRSKSYERIKAAEVAQIAIENLVLTENSNSSEFWNLNSSFWSGKIGVPLTNSNYPKYNYIISVTPNTSNGCTATTCMDVTVGVGWSGSAGGVRDTFTRFFSKK